MLKGRSMSGTDLEIERKFICTPDVLRNCAKFAVSSEQITFVDSYFDNAIYSLTCCDLWLRRRGAALELKWPQAGSAASGTDYYFESSDPETICGVLKETLGIEVDAETESSFDVVLAGAGIHEIFSIKTKRMRQRLVVPVKGISSEVVSLKSVNIDIDYVSFPPFELSSVEKIDYTIGEMELMINAADYSSRPEEAAAARKDLADTAEHVIAEVLSVLQIEDRVVPGKVLEYLRLFRPEHYAALKKCGHLASKKMI